MGKSKIRQLSEFGQSIWLDYISRSLIENGKLKQLIALGLSGMTSNPTIFNKAITSSNDYDQRMLKFRQEGKSTFEIYDDLTVQDIQDAADLFLPVYEASSGLNGYVSLEVNPKLAFNTQETIQEGKRLHQKVNRPNVMFKVPSTEEGFAAIEKLTACGINVNITLIFSLEQYIKTARAYLRGIKRLLQNNGDVSKVRSVASVFVSRVDTVVDRTLDERLEKEKMARENLVSLKGKAAVANSSLIYGRFRQIFSSDDFKNLQKQGTNLQRVLWGSTSTKNPAYSDIKYVTELMGKDTVNTMPEDTLEAFLDHGKVQEALNVNTEQAETIIEQLRDAGIEVNDVCAQLLDAGVVAFEKDFDALLQAIEEKSKQLSGV